MRRTIITGLLHTFRRKGRVRVTFGDEPTSLLASVCIASPTERITDRGGRAGIFTKVNISSDLDL